MNKTKNRLAATQILSSAALFSTIPLLVSYLPEQTNPFLLNAGNMAGSGLILLSYTALTTKHTFGKNATLKTVLTQTFPPPRKHIAKHLLLAGTIKPGTTSTGHRITKAPMIWMLTAAIHYPLFFWSAKHINIAISATLFELWPLFTVLILAHHTQHPIKHKTLITAAFLGAAFVTLSQAELGTGTTHNLTTLLRGTGLALTAGALAGVCPAASIIYGDALTQQHNKHTPKPPTNQQRLWFTTLGMSIYSFLAVPPTLTLAAVLYITRTFPATKTLLLTGAAYGLTLGIIVVAGGTILLRTGNLNTRNPNVNALFYLTPILALLWLTIAGITLPRPDLFTLGTALVLATNLLIQNSHQT